MFIKNEAIVELCASDKIFLKNFMSLLSEKIFMFNNRVKTISFCSIRQKLSNFILEQLSIQKCEIVKLTINKKELAEYLGVQRPSLSRELINMQDDGIIECNKNEIKILDMYTLKETMCK
ncbi:MAG: Crp/Fnr family transcriptional regulator [Clostridium sp.]